MLGHLLQDARHASQMSVEQVAVAAELAVGSIRSYEQGRRVPSAAALKRIADAIGLKGEWVNPVVFRDEHGRVHNLAPIKGGHRRRMYEVSYESSRDRTENIRLSLIRKVLTANLNTLTAIDQLLKDD